MKKGVELDGETEWEKIAAYIPMITRPGAVLFLHSDKSCGYPDLVISEELKQKILLAISERIDELKKDEIKIDERLKKHSQTIKNWKWEKFMK